MKPFVTLGVTICLFVAGLMVGCERTKRQASGAYSQLAHRYDSAIVELVSARDVAAMVPALKDSIRVYQGQPQAAARVVIKRDTVHIVDTLVPYFDTLSLQNDTIAEVVFPAVTRDGITVHERLTFAPAIPPTRIGRTLALAMEPDTLSLALIKQPDGLLRFIAAAERTGVRLQVVDAAGVQPPKGKRLGVGCAAGPSFTVVLGGQAYGGLGVTCGLALKW